jgi:hypothetical protein
VNSEKVVAKKKVIAEKVIAEKVVVERKVAASVRAEYFLKAVVNFKGQKRFIHQSANK